MVVRVQALVLLVLLRPVPVGDSPRPQSILPLRLGPRAIRNAALAVPGIARKASANHSRGSSILGTIPFRVISQAARLTQTTAAAP